MDCYDSNEFADQFMMDLQQQEEEEQQMWEELEKDLTFDQRFELHKKIYPIFKRECDVFRRDTQKIKRAI